MNQNVLVVGELNVDLILNQIDGFPVIGKEKLAENLSLTLGSSSAIFASNLSSQGVNVSFLGMIGSDQFGKLIMKSLYEDGVNTQRIIKSEKYKTGVTVILNYDMDRAMVTYPGAMHHLTFDHIKSTDLSSINHIHISSIFLQPKIKEEIFDILTYFKSKGITVSIDPQWDPNENWELDLKKILPLVDVFMPNEVELLSLTKQLTVEDGIKYLEDCFNVLVLKQGEHGATAYVKGKDPIKSNSYLNENVIDCIGAGDSFDSGFINFFINAHPIEKCLEIGNILGSFSTTAAGGTTAFKDFESAKKQIKEKFNYSI